MLILPEVNEYPTYYHNYITLVKEGNLVDRLASQITETDQLLGKLSDFDANYTYAPGKWTVKEVIGHVNDIERVMSYRLLRISRGDQTPIAGVNEDEYVKEAFYQSRTISDLLEEFKTIRQSTISLVKGTHETAWGRIGKANNESISVRAIGYIIAGHHLHHLTILKERYFTHFKG